MHKKGFDCYGHLKCKAQPMAPQSWSLYTPVVCAVKPYKANEGPRQRLPALPNSNNKRLFLFLPQISGPQQSAKKGPPHSPLATPTVHSLLGSPTHSQFQFPQLIPLSSLPTPLHSSHSLHCTFQSTSILLSTPLRMLEDTTSGSQHSTREPFCGTLGNSRQAVCKS